jgi:hypothetical protein
MCQPAPANVDRHCVAAPEEKFNRGNDLTPRSVDLAYPNLGHATATTKAIG